MLKRRKGLKRKEMKRARKPMRRQSAKARREQRFLNEFRTLTTFDMRTEKWKKVVDEVDKVLTENGLPVPEPHPLDY